MKKNNMFKYNLKVLKILKTANSLKITAPKNRTSWKWMMKIQTNLIKIVLSKKKMKMKISMLSLIMKPIMTILEVLNNCSKMKILLTKESVCSRELVHEGKLLYILPKYLSKDKQVEITIHRCLHKIPSFPISLRVKNIEPMKVLES